MADRVARRYREFLARAEHYRLSVRHHVVASRRCGVPGCARLARHKLFDGWWCCPHAGYPHYEPFPHTNREVVR